jgi:hypothetical protein
MSEKGYNTNLASEFFVLSSLHRLGMSATLTLGNKKAVDIAVILDGDRVITIDVKGLATKSDWLLGDGPLHTSPNHFIVLVGYQGKIKELEYPPRIWIVPSELLVSFIKTSANGKTKYVLWKSFVEEGKDYENAWDLLTGTAQQTYQSQK